MDEIDLEVLNQIGRKERSGEKFSSTYQLATQKINAQQTINFNEKSPSISSLDSKYRYHCDKLVRMGLLEKHAGTKGKVPIFFYNLSPQNICVSDGWLVILNSLFVMSYGCPHNVKCNKCYLQKEASKIFRPIKKHGCGKKGVVVYTAPECVFLTEIFAKKEIDGFDPAIRAEIQRQLFNTLNKKPLDVPSEPQPLIAVQ